MTDTQHDECRLLADTDIQQVGGGLFWLGLVVTEIAFAVSDCVNSQGSGKTWGQIIDVAQGRGPK